MVRRHLEPTFRQFFCAAFFEDAPCGERGCGIAEHTSGTASGGRPHPAEQFPFQQHIFRFGVDGVETEDHPQDHLILRDRGVAVRPVKRDLPVPFHLAGIQVQKLNGFDKLTDALSVCASVHDRCAADCPGDAVKSGGSAIGVGAGEIQHIFQGERRTGKENAVFGMIDLGKIPAGGGVDLEEDRVRQGAVSAHKVGAAADGADLQVRIFFFQRHDQIRCLRRTSDPEQGERRSTRAEGSITVPGGFLVKLHPGDRRSDVSKRLAFTSYKPQTDQRHVLRRFPLHHLLSVCGRSSCDNLRGRRRRRSDQP